MPGSWSWTQWPPPTAAETSVNCGGLNTNPRLPYPYPYKGGEGQAVGDQLVAHRLPLLN